MGFTGDLELCLPLYIANAAILVFSRLGLLDNIPILNSDFFSRPISKRLFGAGRSIRGSVFILLVTTAGYWLLLGKALWLPGLLMNAATLANSFLKRCLGMKEGAFFPPFDQLDFLAGGLAGLYLGGYAVGSLALVVAFTFFLHLGSNMLAYRLRLKDVWW